MLSDDARALLDGPNFGVLSTLMPDGSPHSCVVWVGTDGEYALVATTRETLKYRNIERDQRVALTVTAHDNPYHELNLRGRVVEMREDEGVALIDRLSEQYYGTSPYPHHDPGQHWVALVIEPQAMRVDKY